MVVETTDPGDKNPADYKNKQSRSDRVHNSLEMTLILGTLYQRRSATDEGLSSRCGDDSKSLATLAAGGVVKSVSHVFIDRQGFSSDGRLIRGDDCVTVMFIFRFAVLVGVSLLGNITVELFALHLLVFGECIGSFVITNKLGVRRNHLAFFDNNLKDISMVARGTRGFGILQCRQGPALEP